MGRLHEALKKSSRQENRKHTRDVEHDLDSNISETGNAIPQNGEISIFQENEKTDLTNGSVSSSIKLLANESLSENLVNIFVFIT